MPLRVYTGHMVNTLTNSSNYCQGWRLGFSPIYDLLGDH